METILGPWISFVADLLIFDAVAHSSPEQPSLSQALDMLLTSLRGKKI